MNLPERNLALSVASHTPMPPTKFWRIKIKGFERICDTVGKELPQTIRCFRHSSITMSVATIPGCNATELTLPYSAAIYSDNLIIASLEMEYEDKPGMTAVAMFVDMLIIVPLLSVPSNERKACVTR
jgi:hypothetical protein